MTQDAPLDQKALEAAIAWAQEGTRDDTFSALTFDEHGALIERAIGIFLDALSRRVPAGGELADAEGWVDAIGKQPVKDDVIVRVRMRNGLEYEGRAAKWDWHIFGTNPVDIVAFSIAPDGKVEPGEAAVIERCAKLIEDNEIMDGSDGQFLRPRTDGNRAGIAYATAIRALSTPVKP